VAIALHFAAVSVLLTFLGMVPHQGIHGLVCKQTPSRIVRHQAINDVVARAISSASIPVILPRSLLVFDDKRPDKLTLIPWHDA